MDCFPAFFPLADKRVAIAGGDAAAEAKARLFAGSPTEVRRIWPAAGDDRRLAEGACGGGIIAVLGPKPGTERLARFEGDVPVEVLRPAPT